MFLPNAALIHSVTRPKGSFCHSGFDWNEDYEVDYDHRAIIDTYDIIMTTMKITGKDCFDYDLNDILRKLKIIFNKKGLNKKYYLRAMHDRDLWEVCLLSGDSLEYDKLNNVVNLLKKRFAKKELKNYKMNVDLENALKLILFNNYRFVDSRQNYLNSKKVVKVKVRKEKNNYKK